MRDDLNAIPVFVTVVESGNFASAAAILHVTRSAVGKTIARLEARLGVALFQRTTRRQLLTEEGEQFYLQCREALERIREAEETLQRGKDEVQGRLRVSLPVLFGQRCVAPLLFRLSQRYPLLKLELHYSDRQVNLLEEGFDLAVRIGSLADTGSLRARALGEHGMVLCAAAEYLRQQPAPQTIAGLNEHRTLGYLHNGQLQKWQLYDPQQGEVRFSPQTWLIQMILPPSRRQCSRGWASPGCRTGWWRRRLPMGHCSRCWRPALRCVSPSTRYGRRGRGCRKNAGGDRCPAGRAASYRNTGLAQREITAIYGGGGFPTACKLPARFTP